MAVSNQATKHSPGAPPSAPGELADKVTKAIKSDKERAELHVRLNVEGGQHEERYEFRFDASGGGEVECGLTCALSKRDLAPATSKITATDFAKLLKSVDIAKLAEAAKAVPRIPPDSLVGRLQVTDGRQQVTVIFMADPEQAKAAGYEPPPEVTQIVEGIYKQAAKQLGVRNARP
jgi:hypothetical protein